MKMVDPDAVVARIQDQTDFVLVQHSWTMEPNEDVGADDLPAALVYVGGEKSQLDRTLVPVTQRVDAVVTVIIVAKVDEYRSQRLEVLRALIGWRTDPDFSPLQHDDGATLGFRGDHIWWKDTFVTWHTRTEGEA